jgi:acyl carrier protein
LIASLPRPRPLFRGRHTQQQPLTHTEETVLRNDNHRTSEDTILDYMRHHLGAVIGDPEPLHTEISMDTTFGHDLELESIEFVALADRLRTEFGERVNFVAFLAEKNVDDMVSLTVGDVVRYVASRLHEVDNGARERKANG